jgi:hypothetical protein
MDFPVDNTTGAAAKPPTTDTKANDQRIRDGPIPDIFI